MKILGVKIDNLSFDEILQKIEGFLNDGNQHFIVTPNPEILIKASKNEEFRDILNQADLSIPDGIGLIFFSHLLKESLKQRITGIDLMEKICQQAALKDWSVFLLGAQPASISQQAAQNLKNKYPGLKIKAAEEEFNGQADILFVALGASEQEKFIFNNLKKMPSVKLAMGVGGAFDVISGSIPRAPRFLQKIGLEWFFRLVIQPRRIKRIFNAIIIFPISAIKYHFF